MSIKKQFENTFIVHTKRQAKGYSLEKDREFFSVPVQVVPFYCELETRWLYVKSPLQGNCVYPVMKKFLKTEWKLSVSEQKSARRI